MRRMSESVQKKRTPESVFEGKYCAARKHHARAAADVQAIDSQDALDRLRSFRYEERGSFFDFSHLVLGDQVCYKCRKLVSRSSVAGSGGSSPGRGSEPLDLIASSPFSIEESARSLAASLPLNPLRFDEFDESHPWSSRSPAEVLSDLMTVPRLVSFLGTLTGSVQRDVLSGIGAVVGATALEFQAEQETLSRRLRESELSAKNLENFGTVQLSELVEKDLLKLVNATRDLNAFDPNSWSDAQKIFNSELCDNLRLLLGTLVNVKGAAARNKTTGRQSSGMKLRKVFSVLLQILRLRSERNNFFAIKHATYMHFCGVSESSVSAQIHLGLAVDGETRRRALAEWRLEHAGARVRSLLEQFPDEVAFVGDNVNLYRGMRDFGAGAKANQINMFAVAVFRRHIPQGLSCEPRPSLALSRHVVSLDEAGLERVKGIIVWCVASALADGGCKVDPDLLKRPDCWPGDASEWVPFNMTSHDSSRPAEVWEMLKHLGEGLSLDNTRDWPFYGDMLTCRYVDIAASAFELEAFNKFQFHSEIGLFHAQMSTIQKVLFVCFSTELSAIAKQLGLKKTLVEPTRNYNNFERTCSGALVGLSLAALSDCGSDFSVLSERIWKALQDKESTRSAHMYRFLGLLALNSAWKRLVKLADGEGMFDLIRYLLPFLATVKSSMYFRYLVFWVKDTLQMSDHDRAVRLSNLFVNRSGEAGHAREIDLEFEYLVCGVKRMASNLPNPSEEQLSHVVQHFPLFEKLRKEIDDTFKPAKISTGRSVRDNRKGIELVASYFGKGQFSDMKEMPTTIKTNPLLFAHDMFLQKIDKIRRGVGSEKIVGPENVDALEMDLNEYEEAFL